MTLKSLEALRHSCTSCGGSCHGVNVRLVDADTAARVAQYGAELGVEDPIVEDRLRQTSDGRCVFLDEKRLCRIHGTYGAEAKPLICQQYPLVLLRTETEERVGIDPGCYTAFFTRENGDPVASSGSRAWASVSFEPNVAQMEAALLHLLSLPNQTVEGAIARLGGHEGSALPDGFAARWVRMLSSEAIQQASRHPSAGPSVRTSLLFVLRSLPRIEERGAPVGRLSDELEEWGVEVARRVVRLRLAPRLPSPMVAALLSLGGALMAKWACQGDARAYVHGLAGWSRAMRSPMFWGALFPSPAEVQWLLTGDAPK